MSALTKIWLIVLTINLLILNLVLARPYFSPQPQPVLPSPTPTPTLPAKALATAGPTPTTTSSLPQTTLPAVVSTKVGYMPLPGSGSLLSYTWADLPGTEFYFNPADFPGLTDVRLEVNMRLLNGNGLAFLRLFDVTHGIEIWGSEIQTGNQDPTVVVSDKVQFRPGNNLIRLQAKSLTADTTVFNSGKLKIITRN